MKYGFDQWQLEEIDTDYVFKVTSAISRYEEELIEKIEKLNSVEEIFETLKLQ